MGSEKNQRTFLDSIDEIREYDIPYYMRVAIDKDLRCGQWYQVRLRDEVLVVQRQPEIVKRADMKVLAYDIETTKSPLMFPDSQRDNIMMISYMLDGEGYLIVNREVVTEDIQSFEYSPKPEFPGPFTVFNVADEVKKHMKPNPKKTFFDLDF